MRILFITSRFPAPPLKGDQVRAYHQLRLLSDKHRVTLLSFTDRRVAEAERERLAASCDEAIIVSLRYSQMLAGLLRGGFNNYPFQTMLYHTKEMQHKLQSLLANNRYDLVHVQPIRMAPYLENETRIPRVIDLIDALSLNMERRYQRDTSILKFAAYVESKRLVGYERRVCEKFDQVIVVSQLDREVIGPYSNLQVIPNGIDLGDFPFTVDGRKPKTLIFSGNMGYFPNVDAVCWFAREVLPLIKSSIPDVKFYIVGANPARAVFKLAEQDPGIKVTGYVDNLQLHLAQATIAVIPMRAGSGIQNKVLEAMATGTPVVATERATSGIEAVDGEHLLIAKDGVSLANHVCRLLKDPSRRLALATKGRELIEEKYTWERSLAMLESVYHRAMESREPLG